MVSSLRPDNAVAEQTPALLSPADEHNRRLLAQVRPPDWQNPAPKPRYHLVVIGGGTGGLVSAAAAAGLGATVALVERHLMGGDCLIVGCVPSKGIIRAARAWHEAAGARASFGGPGVVGNGDFAAAMERMRRIRADIGPVDGAPRFRALGVDVFLGEGRFISPAAVEVDGAVLNFRRAIIATGARAAAPPIPGLDATGYLTNETIFSLTELPRRLVVIGAGPIGSEMAQSFARFGSEVTVLNAGAHVLPREDADAAAIVERAMTRDGVRLVHGAKVQRVECRGTERVVHVDCGGRSEQITADELLVAVGRAPNVEGLGLEAAGVRYGPRGVIVDDRLRTSNRRIFAVGDVNGRFQFTHNSDFQARYAIQNALFFGRKRVSDLIMPWCTFTSPEVAHVGMYEADARTAGHAVDTLTLPLEDNDRARLDGEQEGFLRVHLERGTDRILGATLVAEHAGDIISEITVAMVNRVGLGGIGAAIHPYPTQAEIVRRAADTWRRGKLTPAVRRAFGWFFRIFC
ncbi:MAG TPA: mercuric reductase [Gemmatimonadales bacterium]|nr:mercuric reductase [Gemmatimonadales bacterium]